MIVKLDNLSEVHVENPGKKIILTSGTFDLFHVGHLRYLQSVKAYGDIMVVLLSGDLRVKTRKGSERPIIPENERAKILDALKIVDYVLIDPGDKDPADPWYAEIIAKLQPDMYVTDGEDVRFSKIMPAAQLIILPRSTEPVSTTSIIDHIKK